MPEPAPSASKPPNSAQHHRQSRAVGVASAAIATTDFGCEPIHVRVSAYSRDMTRPEGAVAMLAAGARIRALTDADIALSESTAVVIHTPAVAQNRAPALPLAAAQNIDEDDEEATHENPFLKCLLVLGLTGGTVGTVLASVHAAQLNSGEERDGATVLATLFGIFTGIVALCGWYGYRAGQGNPGN